MTVELIDSMGSDLSVVNAARVSFAKESDWEYGDDLGWLEEEKKLSVRDIKLIQYLAKHNHWSPYAHAFLSFRIKAPIFVARQLVKHQVGLAWNEVSRRYVDDEPEFFIPLKWRGAPINAKQGSTGDFDIDSGILEDPEYLEDVCQDLVGIYNKLITAGMAPEQARMWLPLNTMTTWIWSGSLMAFARVCKLRLDAHAQAETSEIAQLINNLIPKDFEYSWKALMNG